MQTQNQKFIKWVPKKDTFNQKVFKKGKTEVFIPKEAKKKFDFVEESGVEKEEEKS